MSNFFKNSIVLFLAVVLLAFLGVSFFSKILVLNQTGAQGANSNEPPGYSKIFSRPFNEWQPSGWKTQNKSDEFTIITDSTAPYSPSKVGQMRYSAGYSAGGEPAFTVFNYGGDYREIYLSFWFKHSSNWYGNEDSGVNKIIFIWNHNKPVVVIDAHGRGMGNLVPQVRLQDLPRELNNGKTARNLTPNLKSTVLTRGQWHRWELVLKINSDNEKNGEAHWWIDGEKVGEYKDVVFSSAFQGKTFHKFEIRPIYGGVKGTVPETQYLWIDDAYLSGKSGNANGPICGNSVIESGEQCDDGNTVSGDGCSATCQLEPTFNKADLNEDGSVDFQDLIELFQNWGSNPANPRADIVKNGKVDFQDLIELFRNWG